MGLGIVTIHDKIMENKNYLILTIIYGHYRRDPNRFLLVLEQNNPFQSISHPKSHGNRHLS